MVWFLLAAAVVLLVIVRCFMPAEEEAGAARQPGVGQKLPAFQLQPLTEGTPPFTADDLAGKVVLLNFWGTWCPPCKREFPHIVAIAKLLAENSNFKLVSVSCGEGTDADLNELRSETQAFLLMNRTDIPVYADQNAATRRGLMLVAQMHGYPFTVVLDKSGVIRGVWEGYQQGSEVEMQTLVADLISPRPQPKAPPK